MTHRLRQLIAAEKPLVLPGVYDGISARIAHALGFAAVYVGSYATGATRYGVADLGYIGVEDMADQVRRLAPLVDVPIVVDAEGGFGNPLHVARSTRLLERAGASAVHIEDHDFGKHITARPRVLSLAKSLDKIKAALDAKQSGEFMVIARTDAAGSLGQEEAIARALAFQSAGADAVLLATTLDAAGWKRVREEITVPVFALDQRGKSAYDLAALGADAVIYYALAHFAAKQGIETALEELKTSGSSVGSEDARPSMAQFDLFLDIETARSDAADWGLVN